LKEELAAAVPPDVTAAEPTSCDHDLGDSACDHKIVNADVVESNDFARSLAKARGEGVKELAESLLKLAKQMARLLATGACRGRAGKSRTLHAPRFVSLFRLVAFKSVECHCLACTHFYSNPRNAPVSIIVDSIQETSQQISLRRNHRAAITPLEAVTTMTGL
jgi:hypothetical protein